MNRLEVKSSIKSYVEVVKTKKGITLTQVFHDRSSVWVRKEKDMFDLNLSSTLVVSRLANYYS